MLGLASSIPALLLSLVLVISGVAKLCDGASVRESFVTLQLPPRLSRGPAPALLPWGELVLAGFLLVAWGPLAVVTAIAAVVLFVAYLVIIVRAVRFDHPVECGCLGRLGLGVVGPPTVVRNLVLVLLAGWTVADAVAGRSVLARWLQAEPAGWAWLGVTTAALLVAGLMVYAGRGESMGDAGAAGGITGSAGAPDVIGAGAHAVGHRAGIPDTGTHDAGIHDAADDPADYERTRIPHLPLTTPDGSTVTLRRLAHTRARLLVYINPGCGACLPALAAVPGIRRSAPQLGTHLVFARAEDANNAYVTAEALGAEWFIDPDGIFALSMEMFSPSAVLLGADGYLAGGPVVGVASVQNFFDDIAAALSGAPESEAHPEAHPAAGAGTS